MRHPVDALTALRACATELNPARVIDTLNERLRGGLPAQSMSDGRGNAETPEPALDPEDVDAVTLLDRYRTKLDEIATLALALRALQRDVLYRHERRPAPKSKEYVRSELKAAADEYDRDHDLEPGTTWAKHEGQHATNGHTPAIKWCLSCSRVKGHFCPVMKPKQGGKDGVLCWWCNRHKDGDNWPPLEHVQAHAEGRKVTVKTK